MTGDILRSERERQQLTIHDIEIGTSIRAVYIEAIENNEYGKLPGKVYAKGFVRNYAHFLNLDGEALAAQFSEEMTPTVTVIGEGETATSSDDSQNKRIMREEDFIKKNSAEKNLKVSSRDMSSSSSGSGKFIIAAVVLIAAAAGLWFGLPRDSITEVAKVEVSEVQQPEKNMTPETATPSPEQIATVTPPTPDKIVEQNKPAPAPEKKSEPATPTASAAPTSVDLQARLTDDCWIKATVDGAVVYENVASAGQVLNWSGKDNVIIHVGNAGAIDLTVNGNDIGTLGNAGDVVERTFTK